MIWKIDRYRKEVTEAYVRHQRASAKRKKDLLEREVFKDYVAWQKQQQLGENMPKWRKFLKEIF